MILDSGFRVVARIDIQETQVNEVRRMDRKDLAMAGE